MGFFNHEIALWRSSRGQKGTTLQRRLIAFFAMVSISVILAFTLLLILFGITGSGRQAVYRYLESQLLHISQSAEEDLGNLSVIGIQLSQQLTDDAQRLASGAGVTVEELLAQREEAILSAQLSALLSVAEQNVCGGAFLVLDSPGDTYPGMFIKKTQPVSSASLKAKTYCLRGSAELARSHGVELLAQWRMDYDREELPFFDALLENARQHSDLPLSRLYYWHGRIRLNGNSETGILLCIPLRTDRGSVYGVCGIEVSDRMFKQLYSPGESAYQSVFALAAPVIDGSLQAQQGLIAGNSYLTGSQMTAPLTYQGDQRDFSHYTGERDTYGGLSSPLKLYPSGSPYQEETWAMAVLMPKTLLQTAIQGSSRSLFLIVAVLLVVSLIGCAFLSRRYLRPIQQGLSSIREGAYETEWTESGLVEMDDLFEELSQVMRSHRCEIEALRAQARKAQQDIDRLAEKKRQEIDPEEFALFLSNLNRLTATERRIFELYLEGKTPKEILVFMEIKENTLKYHNRNIYGKLGVTSRKQLLQFATLMEGDAP